MLENPIVSGTFPYDQPDPGEEAYLDEEREAIYLEDLDEYRIEDDQQANWAVKQILKDRADTNRLIALADAEIKALHDQRKSLMERQESLEGCLKALLMLLPAHAGVIPRKQSRLAAWLSAPRARGGDPRPRRGGFFLYGCSPRTRG